MSPIKKSGKISYFDCNLQTESDIYRGVCFAVKKKETLEAMQNQKSPVKIKRYSLSTKYGRKDVVINKNTTITATTADFKYQTQEDITSIHSLANVAPEQLVQVKGYLAYLGGTKKILVQGSELKKQEGFIADPSRYIKIILWANHTDKLNQGSTYFFNKLRLKKKCRLEIPQHTQTSK